MALGGRPYGGSAEIWIPECGRRIEPAAFPLALKANVGRAQEETRAQRTLGCPIRRPKSSTLSTSTRRTSVSTHARKQAQANAALRLSIFETTETTMAGHPRRQACRGPASQARRYLQHGSLNGFRSIDPHVVATTFPKKGRRRNRPATRTPQTKSIDSKSRIPRRPSETGYKEAPITDRCDCSHQA